MSRPDIAETETFLPEDPDTTDTESNTPRIYKCKKCGVETDLDESGEEIYHWKECSYLKEGEDSDPQYQD